MSSFKNLHSQLADAILTVPNVAALSLVTDPQEGDIRYVEDVDALYTYNGTSWVQSAGGVSGPGSSTDNAVVRWDGTDGSATQNSGIIVDDSNNITGAASMQLAGFSGSWIGSPTLAVGGNVEAQSEEFAVQAVADPDDAPYATFYLESSTSDAFAEFGHNLSSTDSEFYGVAHFDGTHKALLTLNATVATSFIALEATSLRFRGPDAAPSSISWENVSGYRTITSPHTTSRTNTFPDADGDFVIDAATQTLTNKTVVVASNTITTAASGNLAATELNSALAELQGDIDTRELSSNKGIAGGYASLDGGGKIPVGQLPSSLMTYEGTWSAATNTPTLADGVGDAGMVYIVSAAGTVDFGSGNITFAVGDWVIYNGTVWQQSDNADDVVSVNGFTGTVVLDYDDVNAISEMGAVSDLRLVRTDGTSGAQITQTGVTVNGFNQMSGVARLDVDNVRLDGNTVEATTGNLTLTAAGDVVIDAAADSVQIDNTSTLQLRGTGGVPVGLTFYDGDESNYIQVQVPTSITSNRTPQIPDDTGNFVLTTAAQTITNKTITAVNLTVDATSLVGDAFTIKADDNEPLWRWKNSANTSIRAYVYDGFQQIDVCQTPLTLDMGSNLFFKSGAGATIWNGPFSFDQQDPADSYTQRPGVGFYSYATAGTPLTTEYFDINSWAWNGSNGSTIASTVSLRLEQLSASGGDAEFSISVGTAFTPSKRLTIDANGGVNMDFDGKTASNTSRLTVPKDTKTNLSALTRKEATIAYASDENILYADDGSDLVPLARERATATFTVNVTGPVTTSGSFRVTRVGDIVTMSWPQMITSGASSATAMTLDFSSMPTWARPRIDTSTICFTRDNGTYGSTPSYMSIPNSGNGAVNKTYASSAFTSNAGSTGIEIGSVSYVGVAW